MNPESSPQSPVKLQPPGAGLPFIQRVVLRYWLGPVVSKRTSLVDIHSRYDRLTQKIVTSVKNLDPLKRKNKVLVNPIRGLEDSSRFWSIDDVLEHLLIVSRAMESVVLLLSSGKIPDGEADTAKVKPRGKIPDPLPEFLSFAPGLIDRIFAQLQKSGLNLETGVKFKHPWFGPITARQWLWLLSTHQGIHYQQIKQILAQLH